MFVLSAKALFILLRAWCSADDPINVSRAGIGIVGGVPGGKAPSPRLFVSSLPVVPQMLLFMLIPGDLLSDLCQSLFLEMGGKPKEKGLNLSGESHPLFFLLEIKKE